MQSRQTINHCPHCGEQLGRTTQPSTILPEAVSVIATCNSCDQTMKIEVLQSSHDNAARE